MKNPKLICTIIKVLVPICFFIIAASRGSLYWVAGIMVPLVLFSYALNWFGEFKSKNQ